VIAARRPEFFAALPPPPAPRRRQPDPRDSRDSRAAAAPLHVRRANSRCRRLRRRNDARPMPCADAPPFFPLCRDMHATPLQPPLRHVPCFAFRHYAAAAYCEPTAGMCSIRRHAILPLPPAASSACRFRLPQAPFTPDAAAPTLRRLPPEPPHAAARRRYRAAPRCVMRCRELFAPAATADVFRQRHSLREIGRSFQSRFIFSFCNAASWPRLQSLHATPRAASLPMRCRRQPPIPGPLRATCRAA